MLAAWTNTDTIRLTARLVESGFVVLAVTIVGSWLAERWGGEEGGQ